MNANKPQGKVIREGKVAVLYSPGFGAGWYTWNTEHGSKLVFHPALVEAVERGEHKTMTTEQAKELLGVGPGEHLYCGGLSDLEIEWLPQGDAFEIHEYDGSESVVSRGSVDWMIA